jgi:hypothetical protein
MGIDLRQLGDSSHEHDQTHFAQLKLRICAGELCPYIIYVWSYLSNVFVHMYSY